MADGEINRNGATIRIDDDGGVQVEPAPGQEVEYTAPDLGTEAIRESVNTGSISINDDIHYAADDDELDDVLTQASSGDRIYLGSGDFTQNRSFNTNYSISGNLGSPHPPGEGTTINGATWEVNSAGTVVSGIYIRNTAFEVNARESKLIDCGHNGGPSDTIIIDGNDVLVSGLMGSSGNAHVTFTEETSGGLIDSSVGVTAVDNGQNVVGDVT